MATGRAGAALSERRALEDDDRGAAAGAPRDPYRVDEAHRERWRAARIEMERTLDLFTQRRRIRRRRTRPVKLTLETLRWILETSGLLPWIAGPTLRIRLQRLELELEGLPPAFDGYTILHLSDLHSDALPGLADAIPAVCRGLEADLLAVTGDFRSGETGPFLERERPVLEPLARIIEHVRPRDGTLAVLGNHDSHDMLAPLERLPGVRVLVNETVRLERDGASILVVGLDDPYRFFGPTAGHCLDRLAHEPDGFRLFLVHTPEVATAAAARGGDLYLCGHTHGGQICLPGGRPLLKHLNAERDLACGRWRRGAMQGYTSAGAGVSPSLPLRLFCPGEITLIRLRRAG